MKKRYYKFSVKISHTVCSEFSKLGILSNRHLLFFFSVYIFHPEAQELAYEIDKNNKKSK